MIRLMMGWSPVSKAGMVFVQGALTAGLLNDRLAAPRRCKPLGYAELLAPPTIPIPSTLTYGDVTRDP